jgi:trehalose synthase-fused probable maltokinase
MAERLEAPESELRQLLGEDELREWLQGRRWYASKSRPVSAVEVVESVSLQTTPETFLALVQARFATGTHELYQLPLSLERTADPPHGEPIATLDGSSIHDSLAEPERARELMRRIDAGDRIETGNGSFEFAHVDGVEPVPEGGRVRSMGVEQSNSSLVFGDAIALKVFRKLEPGINPELELLRFLTSRGFEHIAALHGWYSYEGQALTATLGVAQRFLADAVGGWELALDQMATDPAAFLGELGSLGAVTAAMHTTLASDPMDPAFAAEEPSQEALSLLTATVDEEIERIFVRLPDDDRLAPIVGRGQDVRERLASRTQLSAGGRVIRTHGDYHLGQTLRTPRDWVIIDFEGEPARSLPERRQKRSPLRDVAGMLRSFAYAVSAAELGGGGRVPADFERHAREAFLERYFAHVDPILLPIGEGSIANLLSIYELEKAIYELQYEIDNRPDWVSIPVAGIRRLLEAM